MLAAATRVNGTLTTTVFLLLSVAATTWQAPAPRNQGASAPALWAPVIHKHRLSNGLPVWIVAQPELPVVQMSLVVRAGTAVDPPGQFGMASLTAALLTAGAGGRSAVELADALDAQVANLSASATADTSLLRLYVPVAGLAAVLPLMADVAQRPTFPSPELERARRQRLGMLRGVRDDPDAVAALTFARGIYGPADRNAVPLIGSAASLEAITAEDVTAFHHAVYRPGNSNLLIVGAVTSDDVLPMLEAHFGKWHPSAPRKTLTPAAQGTMRPARQLLLADLPTAPQSRILVGGVRAASATVDYFPIQVLNAVLRTRFSSARTPTLRDHATGVRPGFDRRRSGGALAVATAVQGPVTSASSPRPLPRTNWRARRRWSPSSFRGRSRQRAASRVGCRPSKRWSPSTCRTITTPRTRVSSTRSRQTTSGGWRRSISTPSIW
jgi:zinc protease